MTRRRLFVYPTTNLLGLLFVLTTIWYAASSQSNSASYLLLFALIAVVLVSIPHTLSNLGGLKTTVESIKPAFAGQEVAVPVELANNSRIARCGICLRLPDHTEAGEQVDEIAANRASRTTLRFNATERGEHELTKISLTSVYPFGFIKIEKRLPASQPYLVYPRPAGDPNLPANHGRSQNPVQLAEGDDFAGVRAYVAGESQRHIDWKAVARGQPMMTKQFTTETDSAFFVDLAMARSGDIEDRLSQLALWLIEAERAKRAYGLRIPNLEIPPSLGETHFHRCMRALALFKP